MKTSIGYIEGENFDYLVEQRVLNRSGAIIGVSYNDRVYYWSVYSTVHDYYIANTRAVHASLNRDLIIELIRRGEASVIYRQDGRDYVEKIKSPLTGSIVTQYEIIRAQINDRK